MRSTIFTSATLLAVSASAEPLVTQGCFERVYDDAHLAAHPDQVVRTIRILGGYWPEYDQTDVVVVAEMADQGHAGADGFGGRWLDQIATCWGDDTERGCSVDCDGGTFTILRDDGDEFVIRTRGFTMGPAEECGGSSNLAERAGESTTYRLFRVPDDVCKGLE